MPEIDEALWADGNIVTRGFRQKPYLSGNAFIAVPVPPGGSES